MLFSLIFSLFIGLVFDHPNQQSTIVSAQETLETPLSWKDWTQDEARMSWWELHGWVVLEELKPNMTVWTGEIEDMTDFHPLDWGLKPDLEKSIQWAFSNGTGIHLHGLDRCEVLYQRFLVNKAAGTNQTKQ
ncbi:MAG: hypothetical protein OSA78_06155 [Flavobacteriales bacterium]|nr:hypothetical protein [Flavobacteriales bacterium]